MDTRITDLSTKFPCQNVSQTLMPDFFIASKKLFDFYRDSQPSPSLLLQLLLLPKHSTKQPQLHNLTESQQPVQQYTTLTGWSRMIPATTTMARMRIGMETRPQDLTMSHSLMVACKRLPILLMAREVTVLMSLMKELLHTQLNSPRHIADLLPLPQQPNHHIGQTTN